MNAMIFLYVTASSALRDARARLDAEDGQTAVEWIGIAAVIAAIVLFLVGDPADAMGEAVRDAFTSLVERATN